MKDIIIRSSSLKREFWIALICILLACLINVYAIIKYDTNWSEMFSSLGFVLLIALVLYLVVGIVRLLVNGLRQLFHK